jgi:hypothetical protein
MRRASIALSLLAAMAATAACTSHSTKCVNGTCSISLSGEQSIEIDVGPVERDLRIGPIEPAAVTVSARGDQARLAAGETGQVGGITVQVVSVSGKDVLLVTRTG